MTTGRSYGLRLLYSLLALMVLAGSAALAGVPDSPQRLYGNLMENQDGTKYVQLNWFHSGDSSSQNVDGFYIYQAIENNGNYTFSKVLTVPDSGTRFSYSFPVAVSVAGNYRYYVTAYNNDGESVESNTTDIRVFLEVIRFTSPAPGTVDSVAEGATYTRNFDAVITPSAPLRYAIHSGPAGMTIDAVTGVVTWTPNSAGQMYYTVRAYVENDPQISKLSSVLVNVMANPALRCALIVGEVRDSVGNPVASGYVVAYAITGDSVLQSDYGTIRNGFYVLQAKEGSYHLQFSATDYVSEWYKDAANRSGALAVSVQCGDTAYANFTVVRNYTPPRTGDSISGLVWSADSTPVPSIVYIYGVYPGGDSLLGMGRTDQNGWYRVYIANRPPDSHYVAYAEPITDEYEPQWFWLSETRAGARMFKGSPSNVYFVLERSIRYDNQISGTLMSPDRDPVDGYVTAYLLVDEQGQTVLREAQRTHTRLGLFNFTNLEPGTYVLFAEPFDSTADYAPGYFKQNGLAARTWDKGTQITIDADDKRTGLEFRLHKENDGNGRNKLRGVISGSSGRTHRGDDRGLLGNKPLANAVVYAIDAQDEVRGWAITGTDGSFTIDRLVVGTYTILVDKVGYTPSQSTVTFTGNDEESIQEHTLQPAESVSSAPVIPVVRMAVNAYPNPANSAVTVSFGGTSGTTRLTLANATGSEVLARSIETVAGVNTVTIETAGLASGVYILTLQQGASISSTPINIVR